MREQITETKLHVLDYWQVVRNRWGVILLTFFMITLASLVIIALLDKKFAGHTRFRILPSSAPEIYRGIDDSERLSRTGTWLETEFKTILARDTLLRAVKQLNLEAEWSVSQDEAASRVERMLDAELERGTDIVDITAWSTRSEEAPRIASAVRTAYEESRKEWESERIERLIANTRKNIAGQEADVEKSRVQMDDLARKYKVADRLTYGRGNNPVPTPGVDETAIVREQMVKQEADVDEYKSQLQSLLNMEGERLIKGAAELGIANATITAIYPEYQKLVTELSAAKKSGFGLKHPKIEALQESISGKYAQLLDAAVSYKLNLQTKIQTAEKTLADTRKRLESKTSISVEERIGLNDYARAKFANENQVQTLTELRDTLNKALIEQSMLKKPIAMLQEARPDINPSKPNVMMLMSIGAGLGLVLGLLIAFFLEYLDTSVKSLDDVERYLGVPVLAVIPKDVGVLHKQSGLSPDAEAYRILRTNIEFNRRSADANAITIVSGGAGEGKSTTLVNLAYICAQGGYNTLMIDGDLRRPKLHTFFDINNSVGLTNYLTTALMLEDVILQTPVENLYFMPSGILPADAAGILNSRRMSELITDVKARFDLVLIDSPPILGVSDASVLASEVDLTVVVIQHRKLPRNMLLRVKQAIENVGGNLLGVVLNNVDVRSDAQYQYYTSYYTYYSPSGAEGKSRVRPSLPGEAPQPGRQTPVAAGRPKDGDY
jgi:capsular exopolysaccharide synthesis family protein